MMEIRHTGHWSRSVWLLLAILLLASACVPDEVCDTDGPVYRALVENHQEWLDHFASLPQPVSSHSNGITFYIDDYPYVVWPLTAGTGGHTILQIASKPEHPRSFWGHAGYLYTPTGGFSTYFELFEIKQLSDNIFCYERK